MCVYKIDYSSFAPGDSSRHSIVVQTMVKTGDFLHPKLINQPYYNKPPFKFWLTALIVKFLGESNFSYRILDGLVGMAICFTVFLFSLSLFKSRPTAYFSLFALLGTHILFFGHGIREAVQDPMMILLMSLGTVCGWYLLDIIISEEKIDQNKQKAVRKLAFLGGTLIGLSTITKSIVGWYALVIIFFYLLFSNMLIAVLRRIPREIFIVIFLSIIFLPLYVLSQWGYIDILVKDLFYTEIYYRATQGFHYVNHDWFYWHVFFTHKQVVPPYLFILGSVFCLYRYVKFKDRRTLFLLCWAISPIFFQCLAKSKLRWYILPAVPGIAIIVGYFLGTIYEKIARSISQLKMITNAERVKVLSLSIFMAYSLYQLSFHVVQVVDDFINSKEKHAVEKISTALKEYGFANNKEVNLVYYKTPGLVSYELFYFGMIPITKAEVGTIEEIEELIKNKKVDFIVTNPDDFEKLLKVGDPKTYLFLPKETHRKRRLFFLGYNPEITVPRLKSISQVKEDL